MFFECTSNNSRFESHSFNCRHFSAMLSVPSKEEKQTAVANFLTDLSSCHVEIVDGVTGKRELKAVTCAVCDSIAKCPSWATWIDIDEFVGLCTISNLMKSALSDVYREDILEHYTAPHEELHQFVLSPCSVIKGDSVLVCQDCLHHMKLQQAKRSKNKFPPKNAIANGFLIGEAPQELKCLNEVELALVSKVKIHSYIWVFRAGCHEQVRGWHTFFKNRTTANMSSIQTLQDAGLQGNTMVVLCGPFTSTQRANAIKATSIEPNKVMAAFRWLVANNFHCSENDIPDENDFPDVEVMEEKV